MTQQIGLRFFSVDNDELVHRIPQSRTNDFYNANPGMAGCGGRAIEVVAFRTGRKLTGIFRISGSVVRWNEAGSAQPWLADCAMDRWNIATSKARAAISNNRLDFDGAGENVVFLQARTLETWRSKYAWTVDDGHIFQIAAALHLDAVPRFSVDANGSLVAVA